MKKSTAIASFALCAAGALGVGALSGLSNMLGSDTLFQVTTDAITAAGLTFNAAGPTGLNYNGTGSGNGEGAMVAGTQTIAPMSRFLQGSANGTASVCPKADAGNAQGLVVALDGITLVSSFQTGGATACNGVNDNGSDAGACPAPLPNVGPAYDGTTAISRPIHGNYVFQNWKDVLAVLFGGKTHASPADTDTGCNSEIRNVLANNWSDFFENESGCTTAKCTKIQHLFRRDNGSGTTDAFAALVGLSSASEFVNASGVETGIGVGKDPMCNTTQALPAALANDPQTGSPRGMLEPGSYQDNDPIRRKCASSGNLANSHGVATEEVCGPDGTLGLVLPIPPTDFLQSPSRGGTLADQYPVQLCNSRDIVSVVPQTLKTSHGVVVYGNGQCPNGDDPLGGTFCDIPVFDPVVAGGSGPKTAECLTQGGNPSPILQNGSTPVLPSYVANATAPAAMGSCTTNSQCTSNLCVIPGTAFGSPAASGFCGCATNADCGGTTATVCTTQTVTVGANSETYGTCNAAWNPSQNASAYLAGSGDSRAYNEILWNAETGVQTDTFSRGIVGAYYRLHSTLTMNSPNTTGTCQQVDATLQIGCLVQASPCSLGYAGRTALTWDVPSGSPAGTLSVTTAGLKINEIAALDACIVGQDRGAGQGHGFIYPFSRKLYLNSIIGFPNVTGDEATLFSFEAAGTSGGPPTMNTIVANRGFLTLPNDAVTNNGKPYFEDFNEQALCGKGAAADGGNNVSSLPSAFAGSLETVCGNGVIEAYEDCDNGAANGVLPATCSFTCRTN
jgi:hypothetical protein